MSSLLEDIMGNGLRVLLLGSYDDDTKKVMHDLQSDLNEAFNRYMCTTLLIENMDIRVSLEPELHDFSIFFENEGKEKAVVTIVRDKTKPIERLQYSNLEEFQKTIGSDSHNIDFTKFRQLSELEKVVLLNEWADLVYLVRHLEATRGGELVELTYLLHQHTSSRSSIDPFKFEFFYKNGISISKMVQEIVANYKIVPTAYTDYQDLRAKVIEKTKHHISRLNSQTSRFRQFE